MKIKKVDGNKCPRCWKIFKDKFKNDLCARCEKVIDEKRAVAVGLKKWMIFSDEDFFIIPEERIITIAPMSHDAVLMYKFFCKQELKKNPDDLPDSSIELTQEMGLIGKVEEARKKLEQLFNGNS